MRAFFLKLFLTIFVTFPALGWAQAQVWIQIEAQPTLAAAERSARAYNESLGDVAGFRIGSGWYAVALGPYSEADAAFTLRELRAVRRVPRDSFLSDGSDYVQQFWPVGATSLLDGTTTAAPTPATEAPETETEAPVEVVEIDETPREARASERALSRAEREALQIALEWEGFYKSGIDGAFGPGTRRAMADYQASKGYEPTGILTTKQRAELIGAYQAVLDGLGLEVVTDGKAGISVQVPKRLVAFDAYEYPFARYKPVDNSGVQVLMISQTGDEATLAGLFDIMQTLRIVPLEGARELKKNSFVLTGENSDIASYTYAELKRGEVKGFTLVWPAGDEKRRKRVIDEMRASFEILPGAALDESSIAPGDDQRVDLLAGLEIRTPDLVRSGFYVDAGGAVLTTTEVVGQCGRITIGEEHDADLVATDDALGLALIRPRERLAPGGHARFQSDIPRLQSEVAVAGYSFGGVLGAPSLTFGTLADIRGLRGEEELSRLAVSVLPGDFGGPVLDGFGAVLGMLQTKNEAGSRKLPEEVSFAADADAIGSLLAANGVAVSRQGGGEVMAPEDLTGLASDMTVLVSCWS